MKELLGAKSLELFMLLLFLLVPGVIIDFVRGQFIGRRTRSVSEAGLDFVVVSLLYYSVALPILLWLAGGIDGFTTDFRFWYPLWIVGPILVGLALGIIGQKNWLGGRARRLRINVVHPMPAAWDRVFATLPEAWVIITLKDGRKVAGWFGKHSSASSDPENRDIFIEKIYELDGDDWIDVGPKAALIMANEISTIEFIENEPEQQDANDDQKT
jgi:hypothetical protein